MKGGDVSEVHEQDSLEESSFTSSILPTSKETPKSDPNPSLPTTSTSPTSTSKKVNSVSVNSPPPTPSKKTTSREKFTLSRSKVTKTRTPDFFKPTPTNTFILVGYDYHPEYPEIEESWEEYLKGENGE